MPSSNKTSYLLLNKWLGTDKPKKDDFNEDNAKLDEALRAMNTTVQAVKSGQAAFQSGAEPAINALQTGADTLGAAVSGHTGNSAIHVTAAERAAWSSGGNMVIGTYTGDGVNKAKVTMGFRPRVGLLFSTSSAAVEMDWNTSQTEVACGFFSISGCSRGITLETDGISVLHNATSPLNGCSLKYNEKNQLYVYVAWK